MQDRQVIAIGVVAGISAGAVLSAITDYPAWIGLGMLAGAAIATAWSRRES